MRQRGCAGAGAPAGGFGSTNYVAPLTRGGPYRTTRTSKRGCPGLICRGFETKRRGTACLTPPPCVASLRLFKQFDCLLWDGRRRVRDRDKGRLLSLAPPPPSRSAVTAKLRFIYQPQRSLPARPRLPRHQSYDSYLRMAKLGHFPVSKDFNSGPVKEDLPDWKVQGSSPSGCLMTFYGLLFSPHF